MINKKTVVPIGTNNLPSIGGRGLNSRFSRFNFTKSILFILIAFSALLILSGSASAVGYVADTPVENAGGATPINTIEDLYNIRNNLNGNYILMADLDFTNLVAGSPYEQSLGWEVTVTAIAISDNDVTFELTASEGSLAAATVQYSFGKATGTATLAGGQFTVLETASGYDGVTPMVLLIEGTNTAAPAGEQDFATFLEVTALNDCKTSYHLGNFKPIGSSTTPFTGTFNGNHHTITGIETATFYGGTALAPIHTGMFAYISGATIKNVVTVGGSVTAASMSYLHTLYPQSPERDDFFLTQGTGMIVGMADANSIVDNCSNSGTSVSYVFAGGIVGHNYASVVSNSTNSGTMTVTYRGAGGIVGQNIMNSTISNSTNSGTVTAFSHNAGGITGYNIDASIVSNSTNSGTMTALNTVGGIVGYNANSTVSGSTNSGTATATVGHAGGIVGYNTNSTVSGSTNSGTVTATTESAGGIVGTSETKSTVSDSTNSGTVSATERGAGGIVGYNHMDSTVSGSINNGTIAADSRAGGIVGWNNVNSTVSNSVNSGTVTTAANNSGGIVGYNVANSTVSNSMNSGTVEARNTAGGIVGWNNVNSKVFNAANSGDVTATNDHAGGITGYNDGSTVSNSMNSGDVTATNDRAGGISGVSLGSISMSFNEGPVKAKNYAGGIAGQFNSTGATAVIEIANCYNTGTVEATVNTAGGIVGSMVKGTEDVKIDFVYNTGDVTSSEATLGGIVGLFGGGAADTDVTGYYIDTITSVNMAAAARTAAQLKTEETYVGWDFINTWVIDTSIMTPVNSGYPLLESFVNVTIKTHPSRQTVFDGERATFFIEMLKDAPYSYQWEVSTDGGSTWTNAPGISIVSTYVTDSLSYGSTVPQFRCVVTSLVNPTQSSTSALGTADVKKSGQSFGGGGGSGGATISNNVSITDSTPSYDGNGTNGPGSGTDGNISDGTDIDGNVSDGTDIDGNISDGSDFGSKINRWCIIALVILIAGVAVYFVKFRGKDY